MRGLGTALALVGLCAGAHAADLAPLGAAPWREAGLPRQTLPMTRFERIDLDGRQVLRITSDASYGNLVTPVQGNGRTLSWSWRLDRPLASADLRRKEGDDTALKVCAMFDLPLAALSFAEQARMEIARTVAGEHLPAATLCYVWDPTLPAGTQLPNAYTPRLRWWVLRGSGTPLRSWQAETRDLQADFLRAFGSDTQTVPPLVTVGVGADADNTRGQGLGYVADLRLQP
jgi:hypothetical protein